MKEGIAIDDGILVRLAASLPPGRVRLAEPLAPYTTFRIGGPADALVLPENIAELQSVLRYCADCGLPVFILGRGSNLLVRDKGVRGVVVKLAGEFTRTEVSGTAVTAGAGVPLAETARLAWRHGLGGMEFAHGIPGTVGGAVVMNAGAYDGEMKDIVTGAKVVDRQGNCREIDQAELSFGYRHSALQGDDLIVAMVALNLYPADPDAIQAKMDELAARRRAKQPLDLPSAGSTFRRPPGYYAGTLIDQAGLKGRRVGDAQVSELHAGFIVNRGQATAADVLALIAIVQAEVRQQFGVMLEPELKIVGEA